MKDKSQQSCKNIPIKMYNKCKKYYDPYTASAPEQSSTQGQMSHSSTPNHSYKQISLYI